jgi:ASC-1-like (ASCH) protein
MIRKCLSLKQPYAELIVSGKKTIELRTWNTKFRGEFLIHASRTVDKEASERNKIDPKLLITGAIIAKAVLYDVKSYDSKNSFLRDKNKHFADPRSTNYKYGFLLKEVKRFRKPTPLLGKLGL